MRGNVGWLLLPVGLLLAPSARAQCSMDTDCKGERICEAGKCVAPAPASAAPSTDAAQAALPAVGSALPPPAAGQALPEPPPTAAPPHDEPPVQRRSKPAMVAGIVMVSTAPIALLAALVASNSQEHCDSKLQADYPSNTLPSSERYRADECSAYSVPMYLFGIGGAVLAAAGIPLIVYGAKKMPPPAVSGSVRVLPWATPQAGGLRLQLTL